MKRLGMLSSVLEKIKSIMSMLPVDFKREWNLSIFFIILLPLIDLLYAGWIFVLLMILQGEAVSYNVLSLGPQDLHLALLLLIIITVARQGIDFASVSTSRRLTQNIHREFARRLVKHYLALPWLHFAQDKRSSKIKHSTITALDASYSFQVVLNLVSAALTMLLLGAAILLKSPYLALSMALTLVVLMFFTRKFITSKIEHVATLHEYHQKRYFQKLQEIYNLPREVKLFKVSNFFLNEVDSDLSRLTKAKTDLSIYPHLPRIILDIALTLALAIGILVITSTDSADSQKLIADFAALAILARRMLPSINQFISSYTDLYGSMVNVNILKQELQVLVHEQHPFAKDKTLDGGLINLKNITFSYPDGNNILNNICFTINPGDRIAIMGPTGRGKSTLMMIAAGIISPTTGSVLVHERFAKGFSQMAYVAQESQLLTGSVLHNIVFGNEVVDEQLAWKVLKLVELDKHVHLLDNGIHSEIGDNGVKFSGGQRQRLGIARALYAQPSLLFLDEATSALDETTETNVMQNISQFMDKGAVMFITHRKSNAEQSATKFCYL